MTPEQKTKWSEFIGRPVEARAEDADRSPGEEPDTYMSRKNQLVIAPAANTEMNLDTFTLGFSGDINISAIENSVRSILGGRSMDTIQITVVLHRDT